MNEVEWVVENPEDAEQVVSAHQAECCRRGVSNDHFISGGDYWDLSATADGFLVM